MSDHAAPEPISYFAYFWIGLSLFLGLVLYFGFVFQQDLLCAGGEVWSFFRLYIFSPII